MLWTCYTHGVMNILFKAYIGISGNSKKTHQLFFKTVINLSRNDQTVSSKWLNHFGF